MLAIILIFLLTFVNLCTISCLKKKYIELRKLFEFEDRIPV